jgi:hypothetical protein
VYTGLVKGKFVKFQHYIMIVCRSTSRAPSLLGPWPWLNTTGQLHALASLQAPTIYRRGQVGPRASLDAVVNRYISSCFCSLLLLYWSWGGGNKITKHHAINHATCRIKPQTQETKTDNYILMIHQIILNFNKDNKVNQHDSNFWKCLYFSSGL